MKLKLSAAVGLALVLATGTVSYAQVGAGEGSPAPKAERPAKAQGVPGSGGVDAFAKHLTLTTEQKGKVQTVVTNYRTGAKDIMLSSTLTADQRKIKVDELRTKSDLEIRAILTAAQSEQAQKDNLIQKLLNVGPARPGMREIAETLKFTDDQKQKMNTLLKDQKTKQKDIAKNANLTEEARQEQLKALRQDTQQKIQALLTDEQKAKYNEITQSRSGKAQTQGNAKVKGKAKNQTQDNGKAKGTRNKGQGKRNTAQQ